MFQGHRNQRYVLGPLDRQPYVLAHIVRPGGGINQVTLEEVESLKV